MMTDRGICVDANVFVAALCPEEKGYAVASKLIRSAVDQDFFFWEPEILLFEVGTALYRKKGNKDLSASEVDGLLNLLFDLPLIFKWEADLMRRSYEIAEKFSERGIADPSYLAVAEKQKIPLITLDEILLKRGKEIFPKIFSPEQFLKINSLAVS